MNSAFSICATVKAPADEVEWFVHYHLAAGATKIFLFFDDPEDQAAQRFTDPQICVTVCDAEYWNRMGLQARDKVGERRATNAKWALEESRKAGIEWMVVIDYDEILHTQRPLAELFADVPPNVDVLHFEVWEAVSPCLEYANPFTEVNLFKPYPLPLCVAKDGSWCIYFQWISFLLRLAIARILGVKRANRHQFTLGHRVGKAAIRTSAKVSHIGSHNPLPVPGGRLKSMRAPGSAVLHFDACGYDRWKWKWGSRGSGLLQWSGRAHRWDYMRQYAAAAETGDQALHQFYQETKGASERHLAILSRLGLVRQVLLKLESLNYECR